MKYGRGRIIALTVLSMIMTLALFCAGYIVNFHNMISAVNTDLFVQDPNYIPTFDDLYERIPFDSTDTGEVTLGKNTQLTLLETRYQRDVLTNFLNSSTRTSFRDFQNKYEKYRYPVFTNSEMRSIATGLGENLNIPVVMLDSANYDDVVLFELTNLINPPSNLMITRDGVLLNDIKDNSVYQVDNKLSADYVYGGVPTYELMPQTNVFEDSINNVTVYAYFMPDTESVDGYVVSIQYSDANNNLQYFQNVNQQNITTIPNQNTISLYSNDSDARLMYKIKRNNYQIEILDQDNHSLQKFEYQVEENKLTNYGIGAVGYNSNALRGMFQEQGFYQISFKQNISNGDGVVTQVNVSFSFVIVNKMYYTNSDNFPRFDTKNRVAGNSEIYNYSYEGSYPKVNYSSYYFDVQIQTNTDYYQNDSSYAARELLFYNIGEYRMTSQLQFYSSYLARNGQNYKKRGVENGYIKLSRYTSYSSILNIFGFQTYYGGQHSDPKYSGPLPFFDSQNTNVSSDITLWVKQMSMTAAESGAVMDYSNMRVSDTLIYSLQLAKYISSTNRVPVKTNFPPVKMYGNVEHATGVGINGEKSAVLSTVAFKPAYGDSANEWSCKQLEVGAPFEEAGVYLVTVYFKVNDEICQQTFYFEIVNSAKITFDINGETFYAGDLELKSQQILSGSNVKLCYDGNETLGQFEVPPHITLEYADFGVYDYEQLYVTNGENNGAFNFILTPGQYRLTVKYGAHNKSSTIFDIIIDNTLATGIKANTSAQTLPGTPENVAIVGAGEVQLTWNQKTSGVNYNNVFCEFYELVQEKNDPNSDRNNFSTKPSRDVLSSLGNLYTSYEFVGTPSETSNGYTPVKTEYGWTLNEKFTTPGLYRFTFVDDVGNETPYLLLIDNTVSAFVQSGAKSNLSANIVSFNEQDGVYVGFGVKKLITSQGTEQALMNVLSQFSDSLRSAGLLFSEQRSGKSKTQTSIAIGLSKVEYSRSGAVYQSLSQKDIQNGYIVLKEEDTYYFRVTDLLGNIGEYYIILTHDNSFGMVYADNTTPAISGAGRGFVTDEPSASTCIVTSTGGMTNQSYVSFSFVQRDSGVYVKTVYLQYYPLTYQLESSVNPGKSNPNYPFSDQPLNNPKDNNGDAIFATKQDTSGNTKGAIYSYKSGDENQTIRLALFNKNCKTPSGMYIITREYNRSSNDDSNDSIYRDYYFIVDNQGMLYYEEGKYQTALKINFGNKTADASTFNKYNNVISSDRTAIVNGFSSKYSWKHNNIKYNISSYNFIALATDPYNKSYDYSFPSLTPRFSYLHNGQTVYLGEGTGTWSIGDPAARDDNTIYQLIISDNSRNISCLVENGNSVEVNSDDASSITSANYDCITLNLNTSYGTKAELVLGNNRVINNYRMEYDGEKYVYVIDPSQIEEQLKFRFDNDPTSMYATISLKSTTQSWSSNGFREKISLQEPSTVNGKCTFDLFNDFLNNEVISNGASLTVSLFTDDGNHTTYMILFDTREPNYNLSAVKNGDNLARTMTNDELPGEYIYGLNNDFVFESAANTNRYLDTKTITYREIDYTGEGTQSEVQFKLYTGADGEQRISFANIVGLRDNEMRYYYITETDYAGHSVSYRVQIQGSDYVNAINFIGAITDPSKETQIGIEMHASNSSVVQFFLHNNSFKFESGDDYYTVLGSTAYWKIGNESGKGVKNEEHLINTLNNWINTATENGTKCSYRLYDRIGDVEVFEFYNLRDNANKIQLDCYQVSPTNPVIKLSVTNYDDLPKILFDGHLASLFKIKVKDNQSNYSSTEIYFSLQGTSIQGFDVTHDLTITVTDPFGRVSVTEYHQQSQSTINFTVYGNTVTQDNVLYVGDERGVEFSYMRSVYNVLIYDAGTGDLLTNLQSFINNDMVYYTFKPISGSTTIQQYHIIATGRTSGATLFDQTFVFDTRLPSVEWKSASDEIYENVDGELFVGSVILDISNSLVRTKFPVTISYSRVIEDYTERVTLQSGIKKYTFDQVGSYEVILRNTVWAEKIYKFEITQIDDTLVRVYDDGEQIFASDSDYKYTPNQNHPNEFTYIPRYMFTLNSSDDPNVVHKTYEYLEHGLEIVVGQGSRVLAGNERTGTDYYYYDEANNTMVWRLALLAGVKDGQPEYVNPLYFATTGVSVGELNDGPIYLMLNGNPNDSRATQYKVLTSTTYEMIETSFMDAHGNLQVSLFCDAGILRDDFGAPCYMAVGNLILVDCYYNGQFVKTMNYQDVFTINRSDAGYYEFVVHDLVGNYLYFGDPNETEEDDISYRKNRYMLVVMTAPMVSINGKLPINGMVYNDKVELSLVDYGNKFLYNAFANSQEKMEDFFARRFCVSKITVTYTGANTETVETRIVNNENQFYWSNTGYYKVKLTYKISDNQLDDLEAEYQFQIISSTTPRDSFSMSIYPDIQIVSVTREGYKIHDFDQLHAGESMNFSADQNPGIYIITLKTYSAAMQDYVVYEIRFNIKDKYNTASNYFVLTSTSGASTTNPVSLWCNPYWLYYMQGDLRIVLEKDYVQQEEVLIDSTTLDSIGNKTIELFNVTEAGKYSIRVYNADNGLIHVDSWEIKEEQSTFGYVILAVILVLAGIAILFFIRMRNKMTTK